MANPTLYTGPLPSFAQEEEDNTQTNVAPEQPQTQNTPADTTPAEDTSWDQLPDVPEQDFTTTQGEFDEPVVQTQPWEIEYDGKRYSYSTPMDATDEEIKRAGDEAIKAEIPGFISPLVIKNEIDFSKIYEGMTNDQAIELWKRWQSDPRVSQGVLGLNYKDPRTGYVYTIPAPKMSFFGPEASASDRFVYGAIGGLRNLAELVPMGLDLAANAVSEMTTGEQYRLGLTEAYNQTFSKMPYGNTFFGAAGQIFAGGGAGSLAGKAGAKYLLGPALRRAGLGTGAISGGTGAAAAETNVAATGFLTDVARYATTVAKTTAKTLPMDAGIAAGVDRNSGTMFVGNNAVLPLFAGATAKPGSSEAEKVYLDRLNLFADALAMAPAAAVVADGVTLGALALYNVAVRPIIRPFSDGMKEADFARGVAEIISGYNGGMGKERAEVMQRLADHIERGSELLIPNSDAMIAELRASAPVMEEARSLVAKGDVAGAQRLINDFRASLQTATPEGAGAAQKRLPVDTVTALERGVAASDEVLPSDTDMVTRGRTLRQGAETKGAAELSRIASSPAKEFENITTAFEDALGGSQAIEGARQSVVDSATAAVRQTEEALGLSQQQLSQAERDVVQLIKEDPTFGSKIDALSRASGIDIYLGRDQTMDQIINNVRRAEESMTRTKDELFANIRGGDVDALGLIKAMDALQPGQLDIALKSLPGNTQVGTFLNVTRRRMVQGADGTLRPETDGEAFERVSQWLYDNNVDYGQLYREIRPTVSQTAELMFAAADPASKAGARALRDFVGWIDGDALDHVIRIGDTEVAAAARRAKDYYTKEYAPFWRDQGPLQKISELRRETVGRTSPNMIEAGAEEIGVDRFYDQSSQIISTLLSGDSRRAQARFVKLMSETGSSPSLITDYVKGDLAAKVAAKLDKNPTATITDLDFSDVISSAREYTNLLRNFPDEAARFSSFIDKFAAAKGNIEQLRGLVKQAEEDAVVAREGMREGALRQFFNENNIPNENGYAVMERIFNGPEAVRDVRDLLTKVNGNPLVEDGIQAAYSRYLRSKVLGATQETGGSRSVNLATIEKAREELRPLLAVGEEVFKNRPEFMGVIDAGLDALRLSTKGRYSRPISADPASAARMEAMQAANRAVTTIFGVLSRTGAIVRSYANMIITKATPEEQMIELWSKILGNPEVFVGHISNIVAADNRVEAYRQLGRWATMTFIREKDSAEAKQLQGDIIVGLEKAFSEDQQDRQANTVDQQTQKALPQDTGEVTGSFGGTGSNPPAVEADTEPQEYTGELPF